MCACACVRARVCVHTHITCHAPASCFGLLHPRQRAYNHSLCALQDRLSVECLLGWSKNFPPRGGGCEYPPNLRGDRC